jgi:two-component system chemotaxis response regulator CheB
MIRVLVADDSPTDRELLVALLASDPEIQIVGQALNGAEAVELTSRLRPDLVVMDLHMPALDGLEATRDIMGRCPTPIVLVSASSNAREVQLTLDAIQAGALTMIEKPLPPTAPRFEDRRAQFLETAKAMAQVRVVRRRSDRPTRQGTVAGPLPRRPTSRLVAIAASTGGPAALRQILAELPAGFPAPVLVVQHIARGFVQGLVTWLALTSRLTVKIAEDGEPLVGGTVYLAPDDRQLGVRDGGAILVKDVAASNGFRPSASFLFESAGGVFGSTAVAVILTGMGSDGVEGLRAVRAAGGTVIGQDESSSVVYGMPREALLAGLVDLELPLSEISKRLTELVTGGTIGHIRPHR